MKSLFSRGRVGVAAATALVSAGVALVPAHATIVASPGFPANAALVTTAYTLQFAGTNREGTAAAIAVDAAESKSKTGGYPYQGATPNADPASAPLYGPSACPKTLVLAADDTPADALAAAGLFGRAALSLVDTGGKKGAFDTRGASLLLTQSGRSGATQMDTTTTAAIAKIKAACTGTINGIVLGGIAAVPDAVVSQFKSSLGDVARVAGVDRDDTAAQIAVAVGGANGASLPTVTAYPNASSFTAPTGTAGLTRAVFLAEDQTGADALAVGPIAARLGAPVLLTSSGQLPSATAAALGSLSPRSIIVLGGPAAIGVDVATAAVGAAGAGATTTRVFGANRYATSVAIAEQLLNLYPDYVGSLGAGAFSDQLFGLARDEGSAALNDHVGWPDALASAYFLASMGGASAPARTAPAVEKSRLSDGGATPTTTTLAPVVCGSSGSKCSASAPLLLTTGAGLAPEVDTYLQALYPAGSYKTGATPTATNDGGFGFLFGGGGALGDGAVDNMAIDLSGHTYNSSTADDLIPALTTSSVFYTAISLSQFVGGVGDAQATFVGPAAAKPGLQVPKACVMPGGATGAAALQSLNELGAYTDTNPIAYYGSGAAYAPGTSLGSCVDLGTGTPSPKSEAGVYAVSLSGNATSPAVGLLYVGGDLLTAQALGAPPTGATDTGSIFTPIGSGSSETESLTYPTIPVPGAMFKGAPIPGNLALTLKLTRTKAANNHDIVSWTGGFTLSNGTTPVETGTVSKGVASLAPTTGAAVSSPIALFGEYSAPAVGGITVTISPPVVPGTAATAAAIQISGDS